MPRQLDNEVEKLSLYVGGRKEIEFDDVTAICKPEQDGARVLRWEMP